MKMSFRWYGSDDKVTLQNIRQIPGMEAIVTAVYDVPVGEVWSRESIGALKKQVEDAGLLFEVIESVPVHEDIKLGKPSRDRYIENYCENIRRLAEAGIQCICYNFMPVFDWTRTQLDHVLPDGSTSLVYYQEQVEAVDPLKSDSDLTLPGWDASYTREELKAVVAEYNAMTEENLWANLTYFLERIIPVAAQCGVNMAIHEDDPCWSISTASSKLSMTRTTASRSVPVRSAVARKTTSFTWRQSTRRWAASISSTRATSPCLKTVLRSVRTFQSAARSICMRFSKRCIRTASTAISVPITGA